MVLLHPERIVAAWLRSGVPLLKPNPDRPGRTQYVKDTNLTDDSPPRPPTNVQMKDSELIWQAEADVESGLSGFIIERDGEFLAKVPEQGRNPFGRPIFQNLQYSDTPTLPLVQMRFKDTKAERGKRYAYRVIVVNTVGLHSNPTSAAHGQEPD